MTSRMLRPNILVIMTDQQSANAMSCAGNTDLHTPALDSLAGSGVRFRHAYCTSPLCAPSRASMMSGRMPSEVGMNDNVTAPTAPFPARSLGTVFRDAGYECAYAGKWHVPGVTHDGEGPDDRPSSGFRKLADSLDDVAGRSVEFLARARGQAPPFLLVASFNEPHGICQWARGQAPPSGEVDDPDWRELPVLPSNFAAGTEEPEAIRLAQQVGQMVHPTQQWDEEHWRRYRYAYYRLCERVDAEIGQVLAGLDEHGLRDDTVVVFTADHGDMQGAHQWNQKKNLYEEAAGVPFILAPAGAKGNAVRDELVSVGLDLLPTLCDYAGIKPDPEWAGMSVRTLVDGSSDGPWRDDVVVQTEWALPGVNLIPGAYPPLKGRAVRSSRHKYMCFSWGRHREQLFDLHEDPGEMINLATSGRHQDVLAEHRRRLSERCEIIGDDFTQYIPSPGVAPR